MRRCMLVLITLLATSPAARDAAAQQAAAAAPAARQIEAAVLPLPAELRSGAAVLGYRDGELVTLRDGSNGMVCLADAPGDARFHVACYHASLEPFMARGRELRAQGLEEPAVDSTRVAEAEAGELRMPEGPAALYSLTAPDSLYDAATNTVRDAQPLYVIYTPWAGADELGIGTRFAPGMPWVMEPGAPTSHIMIVPPKRDVAPDTAGAAPPRR